MRRGKKGKLKGTLIALGTVLFLGAAVAVGGASLLLASTAEGALEAVGSRVTGTAVTVGSVKAIPWSGEVTLRDVVIDNPAGFRDNEALRVEKLVVVVDPVSLFDEEGPVKIRSILVEGVSLSCEVTLRGTNLGQIMDHVEDTARSEADNPTAASGRKVLVERFTLRGGRAAVVAGGEVGREVTLSELTLRDVGTGSGGGVSPFEAARTITAPLRQEVTEAGLLALTPAAGAGVAPALRDRMQDLGQQMRDALSPAYGGDDPALAGDAGSR